MYLVHIIFHCIQESSEGFTKFLYHRNFYTITELWINSVKHLIAHLNPKVSNCPTWSVQNKRVHYSLSFVELHTVIIWGGRGGIRLFIFPFLSKNCIFTLCSVIAVQQLYPVERPQQYMFLLSFGKEEKWAESLKSSLTVVLRGKNRKYRLRGRKGKKQIFLLLWNYSFKGAGFLPILCNLKINTMFYSTKDWSYPFVWIYLFILLWLQF